MDATNPDHLADGAVSVDKTTASIDHLTELVMEAVKITVASATKFDQMIGKVEEHWGHASQSQTVIHKTEGMSLWGAAAVTACFCSMFLMLIMAYYFGASVGVVRDDVRDLKAWQQIHEKRINQLEHKP